MGLVDRTEHDLFVLAVILILVAYFVGASTDLATAGAVAGNLGYIFTGRNPRTGGFAGYPR